MEHTESMHTAEEHVHVHADGTVHSHSHAHTHQNTKTVKNRLARVIGHLHAVERMIDDGRDCAEVLVQLAAVRSAINNICNFARPYEPLRHRRRPKRGHRNAF